MFTLDRKTPTDADPRRAYHPLHVLIGEGAVKITNSNDVVYFDVVSLGPSDWRVLIDGRVSPVRFACRHSASAAARVQARQLRVSDHISTGVRLLAIEGTLARTA